MGSDGNDHGRNETSSRRLARALLMVASLAVLAAACGPDRVHHYRVMTRGPVSSDVEQFAAQVHRGLNDRRGWSLGGAIEYRRTHGPADFTVWLSTASSLRSFSTMCSPQWSCRVGPNVVINEDRWRAATPMWPYGVATYRDYVLNHEVGHWLGFGHLPCTGPGQRAPVMAQQSKGGGALGPCRFNTWPTEAERQAAARRHGVSARPIGLWSPDDPFGRVESARVDRRADGRPRTVQLSGFAIDGDTREPIPVAVRVDGRYVWLGRADRERPDLLRSFQGQGPRHGFRAVVDLPADAAAVCIDAFGVGSGLNRTQLGCRVVK